MFSDLPNEVLLSVAAHLSERDLNAAAQTARRFSHVFDHCLYRQNAPSSFALWWATKHNEVQTARKAIEAGATGECRAVKEPDGRVEHRPVFDKDLTAGLPLSLSANGQWCTPLFLAAFLGSDGVIELLLKMDSVDINHRGMWRQTPLFAAHQSRVVKLLLDSGAVDPNARDNDGFCPLLYAARRDSSEVARALLDSGQVDPDFTHGRTKRTPLSYAAERGHRAITEMLLRTGGVDPDSKDIERKTPFTWAVERGWPDTARLLLETGRVDVNARSFPGDWTPLNGAIARNPGKPSEEVIQMLVGLEEVDLNAISAGNTPLAHVIMRNMVAQVKTLMDSGRVDPNAVSASGMTALHTAASLGRVEVIELLLGYDNVDCNARSGDGFTPLGTAAYRGHGAVVELLLRSGRVTDVNARCGDSGGTPLWWAAARGRNAAVKTLLLHGLRDVDVRCANDDGLTPLDIAEAFGFRRVERKLKRRLLAEYRRRNLESMDADVSETIGSADEEGLGGLFDLGID